MSLASPALAGGFFTTEPPGNPFFYLSFQFSRSSHFRLFETLWTLWKHSRLPCSSSTPRACSNSYPFSWWCYLTVSSYIIPFSCLQSFPASGGFPMNWLFISGSQSIGAFASASVLPMKIQGWFPLGLTGLIFLLSKGLGLQESSSVPYLISCLKIKIVFLRVHTFYDFTFSLIRL